MHDGGVQEILVGLTLDNGMLRLNTKLDSLMHLIEQYRNVNSFSSNYIICVLCGGYHADYQCMKVQHIDYFDRFEYCTSYVDQHDSN